MPRVAELCMLSFFSQMYYSGKSLLPVGEKEPAMGKETESLTVAEVAPPEAGGQVVPARQD